MAIPRSDRLAIARNALTILINISTDPEILKSLAEDDAFLETILSRITVRHLNRFPRTDQLRITNLSLSPI
ncbi:MAG: hypothetical protein Q9188_006525 [Gyalolechia gomerana]